MSEAEKTEPKPSKPKETKHEKFRRLAEPRVKKALHRLAMLGNLGGPQYTCTPEEAEQILSALRVAVDDVERKLTDGKTPPLWKGFTLDSPPAVQMLPTRPNEEQAEVFD